MAFRKATALQQVTGRTRPSPFGRTPWLKIFLSARSSSIRRKPATETHPGANYIVLTFGRVIEILGVAGTVTVTCAAAEPAERARLNSRNNVEN